MPKQQHYTAKNEMRMDCGHIVKAGETFHVSSVFTCDREGSWPLKVLMACFTPRAKAQPAEPPAQHETEQADPSVPANQPVAGV
jgi:hypothetical protein